MYMTRGAARVRENQKAMDGSGVEAGDIDNEGSCALCFCNKDGASGHFRNRGIGRFADVTSDARARCTKQGSAGDALVSEVISNSLVGYRK